MAFGDADPSTPAFVNVNTNWTTTGGTSASFTPPADSLVRLAVFADTSAGANPGNETVTDSLNGATGWLFKVRRAKPDSGSQAGCVAQWERYFASAPGSPITITVVGNATGGGAGGFSTKVVAGCTGTAGHVEGSNTAAVMSIVETTVNANVRVEMAGTDWNVQAAPTAGASQTAVLSSAVGAGPDTRVYVGVQDAVTATPGTAVTMSTASPSAGNANNFIAWELVPSAGAPAAVPFNPQRGIQARDYGEAQWLQRDRRDALTVAAPVNNLPSPLDVAYGAGGNAWHLRGGAADAAPRYRQGQQRTYADPSLLTPTAADPVFLAGTTALRTSVADYSDRREVPQQRPYVSDPALLGTAQLEGTLLGGAETRERTYLPATHAPRWWMPRQPKRDGTSPGLLDTALLEPPLLAGDIRRHGHPALYVDRREVPQQRVYISDPAFYPTTTPTDPLTVAFGAGGTYWLLYNTAALQVNRRAVPQQRPYVSDPALLATALLEGVLLGAGDTARHAFFLTDRRSVPQQPARLDFAGDIPADPLLLAGERWRRLTVPATHADRRETVPPRLVLVFAGTDAPPVFKATSISAVSAGRGSTSAVTGRSPTSAVTARRTSEGGVT